MGPRLLAVLAAWGIQAVLGAAQGPAETPGPSVALHAAAAPEYGELVNRNMFPQGDHFFMERVNSARFVLLGGSRRNACDLGVQARLLDALGQTGMKPVLGLEMVGVDQQGVLDRFNAGRIPLERLGNALNWQHHWSVEFQRYLPVLQYAESAQMPFVGLDIPPYLAVLTAEGRLHPEAAQPRFLPPPVLPALPRGDVPWLQDAEGEQVQLLSPFTRTTRPPTSLQNLHLLRDSQMAFSAQKAAKRYGRSVVILAGPSFVAGGKGIGDHLRAAGIPPASILSVLPWRGVAPPDPESADVFYYCPAS